MTDTPKMKPLFIVKAGTMSRQDIRRAEKLSRLCIVESSDPDSCRFLEPPPDAGIDVQARAALALMRIISSDTGPGPYQRGELLKWFVATLLNYTSASPVQHVQKTKAGATK